MSKSYSERITDAQVMADGIREMEGKLPAGVNNETARIIEDYRKDAEKLNSEQEALKAALKSKTEELNKKLAEMEKVYADAKKRIKIDVNQSMWKIFGIQDKK